MGALAPPAPWIPEDDLLLKNAVEAGASLESLAKGAVQFSRRYNVRELQERWYSLLYDPVISAEASAYMIEFERSAPTLPSKMSRLGSLKETKYSSGKRKSQSVRSCYYALRKRICSVPLSEGLEYLVGPGDGTYLPTGDNTLIDDYMLEDPNTSHFQLQESDFEIVQSAFPDLMDGVISTPNALEEDMENPTEGFSVKQDDLSKEIPSPLGRKDGHADLFENNNFYAKPLNDFAPINHNSENVCQELEQNHAFSSPVLDCAAPFHVLNCSSPVPDMHFISMPDDISLRDEHLSNEGTFTIEYMGTDNADQSVVNEGYLEKLSKELLTFTNEEELLIMDGDSEDVFDKSYYDGLSLLINSPVDVNQEGEGDIYDLSEADPAAASKVDVVPDDICKSGECTSSTVSDPAPQLSETCDEFMLCTLNTEDPDIPCNDDVVFPKMLAPTSVFAKEKSMFQDSNCIPSSSLGKELSANPRTLDGGASISHGHYHGLSQPIGSQKSAKNSFNPTFGSARGIKCEVSSSNIDANLPEIIDPSTGSLEDLPILTLKEEPLEISGVKHLTCNSTESALERPLDNSEKFQCQQLDSQEILDHRNSEVGPMDHSCPEPGTDPSSSAPEQIESDEDLPSFSDIESMILDMDLDPDEQDLYSNAEVLRYNDEAARRTIVRLEQGARSYMRRAIASHGAFAILYGRYSKHYIRKQEVLLGRGTVDFKADIDLGKAGQFNKISRRQATIKLEKDGSFLLKNLGNKFPIFVNNKPVAPGLSMTLTTNCLIEIRGTPFIFDVNRSCVKRFLERTTGKQQEQHS